jgi:magnesium transporter
MTRRHAPVSSGTPGRIRIASSSGGAFREAEGDRAIDGLAAMLADPQTTVWVDLADPSPAQVEAVGAALKLHPLIVEDVLEGNQRAKMEVTDGVVHIVLFALTHGRRFVASEIDLVLGLGFLLTVHDEGWDPRATHHLHSGLASVMAHGPDHLLWAISDDIVDGYFPFADDLGDAIDAVQDAVLAAPTAEALDRLFDLKRELIEVRRAASPTREVFAQLTNRDLPLIDPEEIVYLRDVYDHVIRLTDELDNYRELASSTLDVYLTQINNNLSVIMKRLTGVTVILAGIGAVAGIFGMSEANVEAGSFWIVTGGIVLFAVVGLAFLRRIGWI